MHEGQTDSEHYLKAELYELIRTDPEIFDFLQAGSLDGIWYWDIEHPENEWLSPRFWEVLGYSPSSKQHLASEWQEIIFPEDKKVALENYHKHCADPSHPYDQIVRYRHKTGSTVWVRCRGIAIRDRSGRAIRLLGAHNDITELMRAKQDLEKSLNELKETQALKLKLIREQADLKNAENLLHQTKSSEQRLRTILEALPIGVFIIDARGRITKTNDMVSQIWGEPLHFAENVQQYASFKGWWAETGEPISAEDWAAARALRKGETSKAEIIHILRFDGQCATILNSAAPIFDSDGKVSGAVVVNQDISELQRSKKLLLESETRLKTVVGNLPMVLFSLDRNGTFTLCEGKGSRLFGIKPRQVVGRSITDIFQDAPEIIEGSQRALSGEEFTSVFEVSARGLVWETRWVPISNELGTVSEVIGVSVDITDRKRAEEELRDAKEFSETIANIAQALIVGLDRDGKIVFFNRACEEITGWKREEVLGKSWFETFLPERARPSVGTVFQKIIEQVGGQQYENPILTRSGSERLIAWNNSILRKPTGEISFVLGTGIDITERKRLEDEREKYLSLLEATIESTISGIVVIDRQGKVALSNQKFLQLWRVPPSILASQSEEELLSFFRQQLKHSEPFVSKVRELYSNPEAESFDVVELRDGRVFERYSRPQRIANQVVGRLWGFRDITERERLHLEVSARRQMLETVFANAHVGIVLYRGENAALELANPQGKTQLPSAMSLGSSYYKNFPQEAQIDLYSEYKEVLRSGDAARYVDRPIAGRNYSYTWVPVQLPDGARGVLAIGFDTTDQVRLRRKVEVAREHADFLAEAGRVLVNSLDYETTLRNITQLIVPRHADWCLLYLPEAESVRMLSVTADPSKAQLAQNLEDWVPALDAPEGLPKAIRTNQSLLYSIVAEEQLCPDPDAWSIVGTRDPKHIETMHALGLKSCMAVPISIRGRSVGAFMFASAHSERRYEQDDLALAEELATRCAMAIDNARLYREAQKAIRVRDDFISIASHELRTPLTPMKMQVQIMKRALQESQYGISKPNELLKIIMSTDRQVDRLSILVEDMLDVSRISAGQMVLSLEEWDLSEITRSVSDHMCEELKKAKCALKLHAETPVCGRWDRKRLEQVIVNLLTNAMKYGRGTPLDVSVVAVGDQAVLKVRDQGIGIAKEDQSKLFERFARVTTIKHYGGLGLGLFIARQIVRAHGGTIHVESEPGKGSTFIVELPIHPKEDVTGDTGQGA